MDLFFLTILNMSITASWMILAVVGLRLVLKKAPKTIACALWIIVAIRLICPFSPESAFSLIPGAEAIPQDLILSDTFEVQTGIDVIDTTVNDYLSDHYFEGVSVPTDNGSKIMGTLGVVWLIGVAAMFGYAIVSYLQIKKKVREGTPLRDNIWLCDHINTPFILGIIRPRIYLPSEIEKTTEAHVIAHENAHLKRLDHIWKPLGFLLLSIYWFNPLCWLSYILLCRDIELACDEKVIRDMEKSNIVAYSEALLSCSVPRHMVAACPLAFGEVGVKGRIKSVMNYKKPAFWIIATAIVGCMVVAVCFLTNPKNAEAGSVPFGRNYSVEAIVYTAVQYNFSYTPETAPNYRLTADRQLMILENTNSDKWLNAGTFTEESLSQLKFNDYFKSYDGMSGWMDDSLDAEMLRVNTQKAWRLDVSEGTPDNVFYLLLQLQNGDVYLTYGYDAGEGSPADEPGSLIRWVFKLHTASASSES